MYELYIGEVKIVPVPTHYTMRCTRNMEIKLQAFYSHFVTTCESPLPFCCSSSWKRAPGIHQIGGSMGSSVIGIETAVRAWTVRDSNARTARDFSLLKNVQTGSEAHPASYSMRTGVPSRAVKRWGLKLTIHLRLVQILRMSGSIPLVPYMPSWRGEGKFY